MSDDEVLEELGEGEEGDEDLSLLAELSQSVALAEKFQHEAERAQWEAKREELQYIQERAEFDWQVDGVYAFYREVSRKSADKLLHAMERWHHYDPDGEWTILLNSVGGEEYVGYSVIDQLRSYSLRGGGTHKVTIRVSGVAVSMGGMILQAADHRVMGKYSRLMIHKGNMGYTKRLTVDEIYDEAEWCRHATDLMIDLFLERTDKITRPEFLQKIERRDWWMRADEALKLGFCDAID